MWMTGNTAGFSTLFRVSAGATLVLQPMSPRPTSCFSTLFRVSAGATSARRPTPTPIWSFSTLFRVSAGATISADDGRAYRGEVSVPSFGSVLVQRSNVAEEQEWPI